MYQSLEVSTDSDLQQLTVSWFWELEVKYERGNVEMHLMQTVKEWGSRDPE